MAVSVKFCIVFFLCMLFKHACDLVTLNYILCCTDYVIILCCKKRHFSALVIIANVKSCIAQIFSLDVLFKHFVDLDLYFSTVEDHDTEYEYEGSDNEEEDESTMPGEPR